MPPTAVIAASADFENAFAATSNFAVIVPPPKILTIWFLATNPASTKVFTSILSNPLASANVWIVVRLIALYSTWLGFLNQNLGKRR